MLRTLLLLLSGAGHAPQPKLVVVITVDQLRRDYLDRYRTQLNGGLAMLVKQGADFTEAYQDHAVTETAPGHSTILSGRWPAHTGIIRNTAGVQRSEEHTSELQSHSDLVCRLLLEKKNKCQHE